ncbi:putative membrane lipoprotein [Hirschfeldia incana]|nr:putative membrane lipoprotein [Hirschfeldia incana]
MEQRRGDPRIYIVSLLFLSCILSGGVLLGLYLLLPDPNPLFLPAGMFFAGIPWLFWFLAYLYSCVLKPCTVSVSKSVGSFDPEKGVEKNSKSIKENATSASDPVAAVEPMEREKHVQIENVVVEQEQENGRLSSRRSHDDEDCDRTPLRLSVGNK